MHICKVELENIKSHAESTFEFSRGTTVISGENGAGKTTIIEAIAWTLFDLLDYKKEDFVRRGAKKGVARVTIESGLDERLYTVYRDTGTGYYVYDPALKTRIADKKDEVCRFLWQHLGVEAGTDLDSLFRRAIGVPQGTFTAIFLETPAERKRAFDKLLKVEEYRRGSDELLKTSRFIGQQITDASVGIARHEGELGRFETVENESRIAAGRVTELSAKLDKTAAAIAAGTEVVNVFDKEEKRLSDIRSRRDAAMSAHEQGKLVAAHRAADAERARAAAEAVNSSKQDAEQYESAVARLRELERERGARERLRLEAAKVDTAEASVRSEKKNAAERLENALNAHAAAASLADSAAEQEKLEAEVLSIRSRIAELKAASAQLASIDDKIERLREAYRANQSQIAGIETEIKDAGDLDGLQKRDAEIIRELARLQASLDRDAAFQREILNGLCPILSERCLNLKEGQTLDAFVTSQFTELRLSITSLETEQTSIGAALKLSREAEKLSARLITLKEREAEIREEGTRLKDEREALVSQTAQLPELESTLAVSVATLARLDDPAAKIKLFTAEAAREGEYREAISKIEKNLERLESDRLIIVEQLESFKDLDHQFTETTAARDATEAAHRIYIANADIAATLPVCESALSAADAELKRLADAFAAADTDLAVAEKNYDRERHHAERVALAALERDHAEMRANFESETRRASDLRAELDRLTAIRTELQNEYREKERLEKTAEATEFIRDTLKEAAPLVARNYVYHVSVEANQMFRDITGNAGRTLKWAEDYGIFLEEGGFERPFQNLSGGEQMAAALSVRLALLKQLTDIRIAFFDEPTTNMDAERRENLAQQISRIGYFDQLFVISHDDTFEGYMDHEVRVEKGVNA